MLTEPELDPIDISRTGGTSRNMDNDRVQRVLCETIPELKEKRWHLLSCQVIEARQHRQKQLVFCHISYRDEKGKCAKDVELVVKFYGDHGRDSGYEALQQLRQAGFQQPSRYRVPRPYGYAPGAGILIQERVKGRSWLKLLLDSQQSQQRAAAQAASWLVRLQQSSLHIPLMENESMSRASVATLRRQAQELATAFPSIAGRLESLSEQLLASRLSEQLPLVASHGDYHPGNVFLAGTTITVIDFDAFGLRDAAFDAGYCIAQLLSMSYFHTGYLAPGVQAAALFWRTYEKQGGQAAWPAVAARVASTLLQVLHYTLYAMGSGRRDILPWWLDLIEQWLASQGPATLESFNH